MTLYLKDTYVECTENSTKLVIYVCMYVADMQIVNAT